MKKIVVAAAVFLGACLAFAGDAAVFDEIGFSSDGKTYIFGEYGKTDVKFQSYAEIYTVDVAKNEFVKGEVFKTEPSASTSELSGKRTYEILKEKAMWKLNKYAAKPTGAENLVYLRESETKSATEEIVFKNFEESTDNNSIYYHIKLIPTIERSGKNVQSKFYISVKKTDENGTELKSWKVGTPEFKRRGISAYQIDKIVSSKDGKNLVFVVQKTLVDDSGKSIRYMVETLSM